MAQKQLSVPCICLSQCGGGDLPLRLSLTDIGHVLVQSHFSQASIPGHAFIGSLSFCPCSALDFSLYSLKV